MAIPEKTHSVNKVVINNRTVVDMTEDTAVAADVVSGKFFHSKSGAQQAGTMRELHSLSGDTRPPTSQISTYTFICVNEGDTGYVLGEANQRVSVVLEKVIFGGALQEQVLEGKTFTATSGVHAVGTMPNKGAAAIELSDLNAKAIDAGYYSGGTAKIADAEAAKVIPGNIKKGVTLFGVEGTLQEGLYNIASTDNADGSQNLAITDANGVKTAQLTVTLTGYTYSNRVCIAYSAIMSGSIQPYLSYATMSKTYTFLLPVNSSVSFYFPDYPYNGARNLVGCSYAMDSNGICVLVTEENASITIFEDS